MNPEILICSSLYDFSTDIVCMELRKRDIDYLRINQEHLQDYGISLDPQVPNVSVRIEGCTYEIGSELKSIWFRQPVFLRNTPAEPLSPIQQLKRSQWIAFLRGLSVFDHVAWMNFPARTYLAESKPYQLYIASKCGFAVPETCISNDPSEIKKRFPHFAAIKSLDTVLVHDREECLFTYTTAIDTSDIRKETTQLAPLTAQMLLTDKTDIRVTIIGKNLVAVKILTSGRGIEGDWRHLSREEVQYEDIKLSKEVHRMCHMLTQKLGLSYAAIDLVEAQDETYFIEINPTGEWGWLNQDSRPIATMITSWLADPIACCTVD